MQAETTLRQELSKRIHLPQSQQELIHLSSPEQLAERRIRAVKQHLRIEVTDETEKQPTLSQNIEQLDKRYRKVFDMGKPTPRILQREIQKMVEGNKGNYEGNIVEHEKKKEVVQGTNIFTEQMIKPFEVEPVRQKEPNLFLNQPKQHQNSENLGKKKDLWQRKEGTVAEANPSFGIFGNFYGKALPPSQLASKPIICETVGLFNNPLSSKNSQPIAKPELEPEPQKPQAQPTPPVSLFSRPQNEKEYNGPSVKMTLPNVNTTLLFNNPMGTPPPITGPATVLTTNPTLLFSNNVQEKPKPVIEKPVHKPIVIYSDEPLHPVQAVPGPFALHPKAVETSTNNLSKYENPPTAFSQTKHQEPKQTPTTNIFGQAMNKQPQKEIQPKKSPVQSPLKPAEPSINLTNIFKPQQQSKPTQIQPPKLNIFGQPSTTTNIFGNFIKKVENPQPIAAPVIQPLPLAVPQKPIVKETDKTPQPEKKKDFFQLMSEKKQQLSSAQSESKTPLFSMFKGDANSMFAALKQQPDVLKEPAAIPPTSIFASPSGPAPTPSGMFSSILKPSSTGAPAANPTPNASLFAAAPKTYNFGEPSINPIKPPPDEQQEGEGEDNDDPIEDTDTANPNLSTGNYVYQNITETIIKCEANHLRKNDNLDTLKDIVVSVEKTLTEAKHNVVVRSIKTKTIIYQGLIVPGQTKAENINHNKQNVKLLKLFSIENGKPRPDLLKIQFKTVELGQSFMEAVQKCL